MQPRLSHRSAPTPARPVPGLRPFWTIMGAAFVFSAAINALLLSVPLYSFQVFGRAIPSGNVDTLAMLTVIVVIALSVMMGLEIVRARLFVRAGNHLEVACRERLAQEALRSGTGGRPDGGPLADLSEARSFVMRPTLAALFDLPWTPLYLLGIYLIHPLVAGIMALGTVLLMGIAFLAQLLVEPASERGRESGARAGRLLEATIAKGELVRGLGMGESVLRRWWSTNLAAAAQAGSAAEAAGTVGSVTKWIRYLLQIAVTGVGAWLVMQEHLSFAGMIATSMLFARAMAPVEQIASGWSGIVRAVPRIRRLRAHLARRAPAPASFLAPAGSGHLLAHDVVYVPPGSTRPVLRGVTFYAEPGELVCVLGANRSGKSTLAKLLVGAVRPYAGTVRLDGLDVAAWTPLDPATAIGYVPQRLELLPGTIGENIARFVPDRQAEVEAAARFVGVHDLIVGLPQGYETDAFEAQALLGGSAERLIALARARCGDPPLMVLDEPYLGLDTPSMEIVRRFLADAKERGITTILLSNHSAFLDLADRAVVLNGGTVAAFGPTADVLRLPQRKLSQVPAQPAAN